MAPQVSAVLASRNETAMLSVTVLSIIEAFKNDGINGEIVVVENSDEEIHEAAQSCIAGQIKEGRVRVIRLKEPSIAKAIHVAHEEARGEFIFYTDAHTLIGAGTFCGLLDFLKRHQGEPIGFVNAPIQWAHRSSATRRSHMAVDVNPLGAWQGVACVEKEQPVTWKGMPYMVHKDVWRDLGGLGCCQEHNLGWGVLSYLGIKSWVLGYENWAIPDGVVYHFGEWPENVKPHAKYRTYQEGGKKPGLAKAVALYVFGGEDFLRSNYEVSGLGKYFKSVEDALAGAVEVGSKERQSLLPRFKRHLQQMLSDPPWANMIPETISPDYRALNAGLHQEAGVKYGYRGYEQAHRVTYLAEKFACDTILDYGAGKQTLSQELRQMGLNVADYDPSIPEISTLPVPADLVVCSDVLEHVEPAYLNRVLTHLRSLTKKALFVRICTVPCTSKALPDGSNPHRIVEDFEWWKGKLLKGFDLDETFEMSDKYFAVSLLPN